MPNEVRCVHVCVSFPTLCSWWKEEWKSCHPRRQRECSATEDATERTTRCSPVMEGQGERHLLHRVGRKNQKKQRPDSGALEKGLVLQPTQVVERAFNSSRLESQSSSVARQRRVTLRKRWSSFSLACQPHTQASLRPEARPKENMRPKPLVKVTQA